MPPGGPPAASDAPAVAVVPWRDRSERALLRLVRARGLGFSVPEIRRLSRYYRHERRDPTDVELAGLAQSWSEHCSYKSSRPILRRAFRSLRPPDRVLGTGDAGVLRFGASDAYALRIESHNHPSAVEPYGGAATGIGGILRDVLAVGGRPIALTDPLFFGPLDEGGAALPPGVKSPRYLASGVIAGIRDYGNRVGVPTVSGSLSFDAAYLVNPLVNVGCVGFLPRRRLIPNRARSVGDRLVLAGGLTGRDGIGGVAFASRELTRRSETESRGAVQLGNPILKEPLIHACLEAYDARLVRGAKDLGGGGLATASGELVHAGGFGSAIDLARVPLREEGLAPWEVWISESQERMLLAVRPADLPAVRAIFRAWDVPATEVGRVVPGPYEDLRWNDRPVGRLRVGFRVDPPPAPRRQRHPPRRLRRSPALRDGALSDLVRALVLAPDSVSREPVIRVYEQMVQGHTVLYSLQGRVTSPSHGDATVLRPDAASWRGLAITTAANPWACRESPRSGATLVVEEAARNLYAVGARPDAFTNCLNFGNPEDPRVLGEFAEVVRGLADGARALGFAVPSGNVSFYNGGLRHEIPPTPVLLATGILPDVRRAVSTDLKAAGNTLYLIGRSARDLGGSLYARRRRLARLRPPAARPGRVRAAGERLLDAMARRLVRSAHDVAEGGLATTVCEMAFGGGLGFRLDLTGTALPSAALALAVEGESRWVVEVAPSDRDRFERTMRGVPTVRLGDVTDPPVGEFGWGGQPVARVDLLDLYASWRSALELP